jgi:hypothetical protein
MHSPPTPNFLAVDPRRPHRRRPGTHHLRRPAPTPAGYRSLPDPRRTAATTADRTDAHRSPWVFPASRVIPGRGSENGPGRARPTAGWWVIEVGAGAEGSGRLGAVGRLGPGRWSTFDQVVRASARSAPGGWSTVRTPPPSIRPGLTELDTKVGRSRRHRRRPMACVDGFLQS